MTKLSDLPAMFNSILVTAALEVARSSGFTKRESKFTAPLFVQTLVFSWLGSSDATLGQLTQTAAARDLMISAQGIDNRFTESGARVLRHCLERAVEQVIDLECPPKERLKQFNGIYVYDSSTIVLPKELSEDWPGCGGRGSTSSSKIHVRFELTTGIIDGPILSHGRQADATAETLDLPLPKGCLRLGDLAYNGFARLKKLSAEDVYWISRLPVNTRIFDAQGNVCSLAEFLAKQSDEQIDQYIKVGAEARMNCRLIARRVPPQIAEQRRRRMNFNARRHGRALSKVLLALADWQFFITNIEPERCTFDEIIALARARWQVELLFKLWKSLGKIDESRSENPQRIICEYLAKLLAMLVQHWIILLSRPFRLDDSLWTAASAVAAMALSIALSFGAPRQLRRLLIQLGKIIASGARKNKRSANPATFQALGIDRASPRLSLA